MFVDNATTGCNAVLRSFPFEEGDDILVTSLGYGGVTNAAIYAARVNGAKVVTVDLPGPGAPTAEYTAHIAAALTPRTRMAIVDHITSQTALVMPLKNIIDACHANGTLVLVDAAHTPGAIEVDIASYGADWYTANLHKWALTPRSAGILWVAPQHHAITHPTVISWGLDSGITAQFDLLGTRDPAAFLVAPFAFNLLEEWGGSRLMAHNHSLVMQAASELSEAWGQPFATPEEQIGPMANVALPASLPHSADDATAMQTWLREEHGIELPVFATDECLRVRLSAQIYNTMEQFHLLRDAVLSRVTRP
jgi:isopenicillin-N epimerase